MDRASRDADSQITAGSLSAIMVRSESLMADAREVGQEALPQIVRQVQENSCQPHCTFWRRVLFFWWRIYIFECRGPEKASVLDLRIPVPLPIIGALLQQKLSWTQAFRFIEQSRRPQGIPPERFLESCMSLELLRLYEGKNDKEELLVIGFD